MAPAAAACHPAPYVDVTALKCAAADSSPAAVSGSLFAAGAAALNTVPLHQLQLSSHAPLQAATRQCCPGCDKPRAFFCYDCVMPLMHGMPNFTALPVEVHIVMHGESNAQATGTHAAVLAPQCVTLWRHNDGTSHHRRQPASKLQLPDWDPETTAVLYPESCETPVVGLWGRLEQHGTSKQEDRRWQPQPRQTDVVCAGTRQAAEQQQQQQRAADQLMQRLQRLTCSDARAATCIADTYSSCGCSGNCCSHQLVAQPVGCHVATTGPVAVQTHGGRVGAAAPGSCCVDASRSCSSATTSGCATIPSASSTSYSSRSSSSSSSQHASRFPYKTIIILEGNWAKARTLLKHPQLAALPRLQLPPTVRSLFWRRGTGSFRAAVDCGVCTIEALYLLCRQLQPEPEGRWDDLLWLWVYQRQLVQQRGSRQTRQEMQQNYEAACGAV